MLLLENSFSRHSWHAASRKPHLASLNRMAFIRKQNPFVLFAVIKLVVHSSLTSCPGSSPKECSFWKTPSPDTPGTLPQENHAFVRKQNFSCFSRLKNKQTCTHVAVIKLVVHSSLASCPGYSPKKCSFWKTPSPDTLWRAASRKPHIYQKTKPFRVFHG